MNATRDHALWYAQQAFQVIPLRPGTKRANGDLLGTGYRLAAVGSSDPEQITEWWSAEPMGNVGIVCGAPSNLLVVDFDSKPKPTAALHSIGSEVRFSDLFINPFDSIRDWQEETGVSIPRGPVCRTPNGLHYYLRLPDSTGHVPSPVGWLPGVDVRADDSYVVAPPSVIQGGSGPRSLSDPQPLASEKPPLLAYKWTRSMTPGEFTADLDAAVAPEELLAHIREHRGSRSRQAGADHVGGWATGPVPVEEYRLCGVPPWLPDWQEFWRVAWSVLARGASKEEAGQVLREVRDATGPKRGLRPWEDYELDRMVARAARRQGQLDADFAAEFGPVMTWAGRRGFAEVQW